MHMKLLDSKDYPAKETYHLYDISTLSEVKDFWLKIQILKIAYTFIITFARLL